MERKHVILKLAKQYAFMEIHSILWTFGHNPYTYKDPTHNP